MMVGRNIPGSLEAKPMRDGRILVLAKNQETVSKAIQKGNNYYDICNLKTTRMDNMNTCQGTVFGRALLTESLEDLAESLKSYQVSKIERIESIEPEEDHQMVCISLPLAQQILCGPKP
jgi:hypothetical protein